MATTRTSATKAYQLMVRRLCGNLDKEGINPVGGSAVQMLLFSLPANPATGRFLPMHGSPGRAPHSVGRTVGIAKAPAYHAGQ